MRVNRRFGRVVVSGCVLVAAMMLAGTAQDGGGDAGAGVAPEKVSREDAIRIGVERVVAMEESDPNAQGERDAGEVGGARGAGEWPYEGVYREGGEIPIGYRVGGTAIACLAMVRAPGYGEDEARRDAVARGVEFVIASVAHPKMSIDDYDAGYDVRGWGYAYGLMLLSELKSRGLIPAGREAAAQEAASFFVRGVAGTEIPQIGGWNYARGAGRERVAPPSTFMTASTLQALFMAAAAGYEVDGAMIERALRYLESASAETGEFVYSGTGERGGSGVPGATGRMLACETTLMLAGRGSPARVRAALDAFIAHWDRLEERRAKTGTHVGPFGVAPYYFYYAHYYAAMAVELLPRREQREYRARVEELIFRTRTAEGIWNDRVFGRTANYGTSMAVMALLMRDAGMPAGWGENE